MTKQKVKKFTLNLPRWRCFSGIQPYAPTILLMQAHAKAVRYEGAAEEIWLLEHEPVLTGGTSAKNSDLLAPGLIPVVRNGRGGQWTYHGPGQRIIYVILDISSRGRDVKALVNSLESWIIASLADCGVTGKRRKNLPGIWVQSNKFPSGLDKIAAIGIRISHWVSWHGLAINLNPDLTAFNAIVPCGVSNGGVTSLAELGVNITLEELDVILKSRFHDYF